jgi:hypothetical protein
MKSTCALIVFVFGLGIARADDAATRPFNGADLSGWKFRGDQARSKWKVGHAELDPTDATRIRFTPNVEKGAAPELVGTEHSLDIYTEAKFGDCRVEVEVMVPKNSNSGIYLMGEYEVQVLDSWGKKEVGPGDMGGIYVTAAPRVNASKKPGEWQKFIIEFQAPRFENGKKTQNAKFIKVILNDQLIHENVEAPKPTTSCLTGREGPTGPLMLQGDHGPIAYRNLVVKPLK